MKILFSVLIFLFSCSSSPSRQWYEWVEMGDAEMKNKNYIEAIKYYSKGLEVYPKNQEAFFKRAYAKSYLNDHQGAIEDATQAIKINENLIHETPTNKDIHAVFYFGRAEIKALAEDMDGALQDCNSAIEINPTFGASYLLKAKIQLLNQNTKEGCINLYLALKYKENEAQKYINDYCK